ncbi:MAG: hypothetical protein ACYS47_06525 [Planctomycetota bacterium]
MKNLLSNLFSRAYRLGRWIVEPETLGSLLTEGQPAPPDRGGFFAWLFAPENPPGDDPDLEAVAPREGFFHWLTAFEPMEVGGTSGASSHPPSFVRWLFAPEPLAGPDNAKAEPGWSRGFLRWFAATERLPEPDPVTAGPGWSRGFLRWLAATETIDPEIPAGPEPSGPSFLRWFLTPEKLARDPRDPAWPRFPLRDILLSFRGLDGPEGRSGGEGRKTGPDETN